MSQQQLTVDQMVEEVKNMVRELARKIASAHAARLQAYTAAARQYLQLLPQLRPTWKAVQILDHKYVVAVAEWAKAFSISPARLRVSYPLIAEYPFGRGPYVQSFKFRVTYRDMRYVDFIEMAMERGVRVIVRGEEKNITVAAAGPIFVPRNSLLLFSGWSPREASKWVEVFFDPSGFSIDANGSATFQIDGTTCAVTAVVMEGTALVVECASDECRKQGVWALAFNICNLQGIEDDAEFVRAFHDCLREHSEHFGQVETYHAVALDIANSCDEPCMAYSGSASLMVPAHGSGIVSVLTKRGATDVYVYTVPGVLGSQQGA